MSHDEFAIVASHHHHRHLVDNKIIKPMGDMFLLFRISMTTKIQERDYAVTFSSEDVSASYSPLVCYRQAYVYLPSAWVQLACFTSTLAQQVL